MPKIGLLKRSFILPVKASGGISSGYSIRETAIKESEEEAGLPEDLAKTLLKPAGCIRYT